MERGGFSLFATSTFWNNGNSNWTGAAVGDFNGDGRKAIVLVKNQHSNFAVLDYPDGASQLRILSTADLNSAAQGAPWTGIAATDWLGDDDDELRVHGLDGVRVIDASVMPAATSTDTNALTIMIAE
jgi:hypothetical protein